MKLNSVRARLTLLNVAFLALILACFAVTIHYTVRLTLTASVDQEQERRMAFEQGATLNWMEGEWERERNLLRDGGRDGPRGPGDDPRRSDRVIERAPGTPLLGPFAGRAPGGRDRRDNFNRGGQRRRGMFTEQFLPPALFDSKGNRLNRHSADKLWHQGAFQRSLNGETVLETVQYDGSPVRLLSQPIRREGSIVGVIQVIRPLDELEQMLDNLDRTLLLLILPALFVAGLGGALLADRSLRPVRRISQAASQLGVEDLSLRLTVKGNDEFSELATNFNRMTERLESAFQNLEATYKNLESAYERQRRFTADASHELRTPLTTIKANTSLALSGPPDLEAYEEALHEADAAANSMSRIVDDLLFLARSDSDGLRLNVRTFSALELVRSVAAEVNKKRAGTPVRASVSDPHLEITGDPHHLRRLLLNLAENAIRHTPPEGIVTVLAERRESGALLRVEDTGEGIAPGHLPRVFDRFYRVDEARTREEGGAGLGLSICRSIVEAHNGTIEMESRPGEGTTVTVLLPSAGSVEGETERAEEEPQTAPSI